MSEEDESRSLMGCALYFALPIAIGVGCLVGFDHGIVKGIAAGCLVFPGVILIGLLM